MRIQHNIAALNSYRNLGANNTGVSKNLEKLSSGYRINRAGDDAAGLAISEKMRSQITGLNTATKNANDGISLVQTAEGALTEVHSMLNRMVEIATQSANGVYEDGVDRAALQDEMNALTDEIDRISAGTDFNKRNLLDGSVTDGRTTSYAGEAGQQPNAAGADDTYAGVDLKFNVAGKFGKTDLTLSFGAGDNESVTFSNNGQINITVKKGESTSAERLSQLVKENVIKKDALNNLKKDGTDLTDADKAEFKKLVLGATFEGKGIIKGNGDIAHFNEGKTDVADSEDAINLQIGDTNEDFNKLDVGIRKMSADTLGLNVIDVKSEEKAGAAVEVINTAINMVSTQRGKLGAIQNRLEHTINNLSVNAENMTAAESRIRDVDMAKEMMDYTKNNILVQASQAMLAQANQVPQGVLQLLQ